MSDQTKPDETIAWCGGLPLRVSSPVADILAAVWLGFQISKQTLEPGGPAVFPGKAMEPQHYGSPGVEEGPYDTANEFLQSLGAMTPMQREALLSEMGLKFQEPKTEYDPTADTLREMMESDPRIVKDEE